MIRFLFILSTTVLLFQASSISIDKSASNIEKRFGLPDGYERVKVESEDFGQYLRCLPLKPWGSFVKYFNGKIKNNEGIYCSVFDQSIGNKDLHQCADAVMRLRADYLFAQKKYNKIHFNFLSDGKPRYFIDFSKGDYSQKRYWQYMEYIFSSANTRSLLTELKPIPIENMQIGDVFIQKGNPYGHAIMVVDMAYNPKTRKKLFMLAQSYMPAQETQILINPNTLNLSPWYELKDELLYTPEWDFKPTDLRRF